MKYIKLFEEKFGEVVYCPTCKDILVFHTDKYRCIRCHEELSVKKYNELKDKLKLKTPVNEYFLNKKEKVEQDFIEIALKNLPLNFSWNDKLEYVKDDKNDCYYVYKGNNDYRFKIKNINIHLKSAKVEYIMGQDYAGEFRTIHLETKLVDLITEYEHMEEYEMNIRREQIDTETDKSLKNFQNRFFSEFIGTYYRDYKGIKELEKEFDIWEKLAKPIKT